MKNKKISIIISVYNTEKYLDKMLTSIIKQTYKNLEILIVNDCSPDNSIKKIKEYQKQDSRIILINNKINKGLSYSRNIAIEKATGDYIGFIDSDDYIPEDYYEKLINSIQENDSDISICDIKVLFEKEKTEHITKCGNNKDKYFKINCGLSASACNKLFKSEVIKKEKFFEGKVNEDVAVIIPLMINSKKVSYTSGTFYNYIQRNTSIQNSSISDKRFDIFETVEIALEKIKENKDYEEYKDIILFQQIIMLFLYVLPKEKNVLKRKKLLKKYYKLSKKYNLLKNKQLKQFYKEQGSKTKLYYKIIFTTNQIGLSLLTSLFILGYDLLKKIIKNQIIKKEITLSDLKQAAIKQSKLKKNKITISVAVPNYNYEKYLYERIYSILYQKIKIDELIILDDCSKDNSKELINKLYEELKGYINIKKVYNEKNSGSAFKQWKKGIELASKEYVWIAEADDYSDKSFLSKAIKPIKKNNDIIISYVDTSFIDAEGIQILRSIKSEIDIQKTNHWKKSYINDGKDEFEKYTYLNCTIANVSSALIKKDDYTKEFEISGKYKQAGDWLLYANIMQKGKIAYYNKALNYYRLHGNNVSSVTKKQDHIEEIKNIHKYYDKNYSLNKEQKEQIKKRYKFLEKVWDIEV